jgi:succinoglycan biosynthesis protein ExoA
MTAPDAYSVVIACTRASTDLRSLAALRRLSSGSRPREILLAVGGNPSHQRNLGVKACSSPLVYFLDDDSEVPEGTPEHLSSHFTDRRTAAAGGPNLISPDASPFERSASAVLASWLGSFSVRYRYTARGAVKEASEKDLILCNMMVRREAFLREGGFREDLYPNEENEFLNRLMHRGYQLMYDPRAHVFRQRRKDWGPWLRQSFRYGQGRARQMRVYPCLSDMVHLAPAFFLLYILWLVLIVVCPPCGCAHTTGSLRSILLVTAPLALYLTLAIATGLSAASWHRRLTDAVRVPSLILSRHLAYGVGLWAGLFGPSLRPDPREVELFKALSGPKGWTLRRLKPSKGSRP